MIIVRITDGLGNQMFQYAVGRMLAKRLNKELFLDISFYDKQNIPFSEFLHRNYELNNYSIKAKVFDYKQNIKKGEFCLLYGETSHSFDHEILDLSNNYNYILSGYWQSWKYFNDINSNIKHELTLTSDKLSNNSQDIIPLIKRCVSIAIHMRRTDYQNTIGYLPLEYYKDAIQYISQKVDNAFYFIFSDAPSEAESFASQLGIKYMLLGNLRNIEDMYLMSICNHNIIANSSFSWWSAWLNSNPQKIIIAPKKWYRRLIDNYEIHNYQAYNNLIPKDWICL